MEEPIANANTQILCRVCLSADPKDGFLSIFDNIEKNIIAEAINELAEISVSMIQRFIT
jgi:hypothetical protein